MKVDHTRDAIVWTRVIASARSFTDQRGADVPLNCFGVGFRGFCCSGQGQFLSPHDRQRGQSSLACYLLATVTGFVIFLFHDGFGDLCLDAARITESRCVINYLRATAKAPVLAGGMLGQTT